MKQIILILSILTGLSSCITETYEKPRKTQYAYNAYQEVRFEFLRRLELFNNAYWLNQWKKAPTTEQKQNIEDKYFSTCKIRQSDDTIRLIFNSNYYGSWERRFLTSGSDFNQPGNAWTAIWNHDTVHIVNLSTDLWKLTSEQQELEVQLKDRDAQQPDYSLSGTGCFQSSGRKIYVNTTKPLLYTRSKNPHFYAGKLTLNIGNQNAEFPVEVVIKSSSLIEIAYRGITENWSENEYYYPY